MEDVLGIYQKPYNLKIPVICMDEKPIQLLDEIIERVNAKPLRTDPDTGLIKPSELEKIDYQYERCGVASIFVFTEPLAGWRYVRTLNRRTKGDFAMMVKEIGDTFYPDIDRTILVADNLNTHNISSFYEVFPPKTAYELSQKFEFHYTPLHGSWLNIAECELSSLAVQVLGNQRINSVGLLNEIISDWQSDRNGYTGTTITGTLTLYKKNGTSWDYVTSWSKSSSLSYLDITGTYTVSSAGTYKVVMSGTVTGNGYGEPVSITSSEKTCV